MASTPPENRRTRIHVVSDVHGNARDLARAGEGADALICLGDLVLFLDYADHSRGIFPDLFGVENADRLVELRTARRFEEARELGGRLWAGVGGDRAALIEKAVRKQYGEMFPAFPTPTYATYGNVDMPQLWPEFAGPGTTVLDGQRAEIGGRVFGFVGGGLRTPMRTPTRSATRSTPPRSRPSAKWTCCAPTSRRRCRNSSTTPWPAASNGAAAPCSTRSAAPAPATPCSAMSTSRSPAGCGSGPPSA